MYIFLFILLLVVFAIAVFNSIRIITIRNDLEDTHEIAIEQTNMHYNTIISNLNNKLAQQQSILNSTYEMIKAMEEYTSKLDIELNTKIKGISNRISLNNQYYPPVQEEEKEADN